MSRLWVLLFSLALWLPIERSAADTRLGSPPSEGLPAPASSVGAASTRADRDALLAGAPSPSRARPPSDQAIRAYLGLKILSIDIDIRGRPLSTDFKDVIVLREGEALKEEDLRRSIELIWRHGRIDDVAVYGERKRGGVAVTFRIRPALLVRRVSVDGNKVFKDRAIRSQLSIGPGSVYSWREAKKQAERLRLYYAAQGYRHARVTPSKKRVKGGIDVHFRIVEGEPLRVAAIDFEGDFVEPEWKLIRALKYEVGERFIPSERERHRRLVVRWLRRKKHLGARVEVVPSIDDRTNQVALRVIIEEGPEIRVEFLQKRLPDVGLFNGLIARRLYHAWTSFRRSDEPLPVGFLRRGELLDVLDIENEQQFTAGFAREAAERIRTHLVQRGFNGAEVKSEMEETESPSRLLFRFIIDPGRRVRLESVDFVGNEHFSSELLRGVFLKEAMTRFAPEGIYTEQAVEQAVALLQDYYRSRGYLSAELTYTVQMDKSPLGPQARILIKVEEGSRTLTKKITISGNRVISTEELKAQLVTKEGHPYDVNQVRESINLIEALYAQRGYIYAYVSASHQLLPDDATGFEITYAIEEGIQAFVGELVIRGLRRTRPIVIRRELTVQPGDVYRPPALETSRRRMLNTGLFERAPIVPVGGERIKDLVIDVKESPARLVDLSGGVSLDGNDVRLDSARYDVSLELAHKNLWGLGHRISGKLEFASSYLPLISAWDREQVSALDYADQLGRDLLAYVRNAASRRIILTYQSLYFIGLRTTARATATLFERERLKGYLIHRNAASFSFSFRDLFAGIRPYLQLQGVVRRPDSSETIDKLQLWPIDKEQRLFLEPTLILLYDRRRSHADAPQGYIVDFRTELTQAYGCGSTWNSLSPGDCVENGMRRMEWLAKVSAGVSFQWPLSSWLRMEGRTQGGYLHPGGSNDGAVPLEKRFFLGGASTVRGYSQDSLGPTRFRYKYIQPTVFNGWSAVPTGGNLSLNYSMEAVFPLERWSSWLEDVEFALFHDGGNVFWTGASLAHYRSLEDEAPTAADIGVPSSCLELMDARGLRLSFGAGLRYRTSIGPIRLDLGVPLSRRCTAIERPWIVHFSIGLL